MSDVTRYLTLTPRDPIIARDGRPFGAGLRMKSLDWIYPSVLAGSLRTMLGNLAGGFSPENRSRYDQLVNQLKSLSVAGPFPSLGTEMFLPYPGDIEVLRNEQECLEAYSIRPVDWSTFGVGSGCNLPSGLQPAVLSPEAPDGFKPEQRPAFMVVDSLAQWLVDARGISFPAMGSAEWPDEFLHTPAKDVRMHVSMENEAGTAKTEAGLFQSVGLDLSRVSPSNSSYASHVVTTLSVRVTGDDSFLNCLKDIDELSPLGGERRLIRWNDAATDSSLWECPKIVRRWLDGTSGQDRGRLRMLIASPAIFRDGWKPKWLETISDDNGTICYVGEIPCKTGVHVRLVSACVKRWRPISGWGYEHGKVGTKPIRRLVPAGSVYFFEVESGDVSVLTDRWLKSVCDDEQDRRDGFGLVVWGNWRKHDH